MPVALVLNILGRAETMQRELAQSNATTPQLQHLEATSLEELSHTLIYQGAIAGARDMAECAVAIEEDLLKGDPENPKHQREFAVALDQLGDAHYAAGNYAPAEALFTRALAMTQTLADAAPDSDSLQDDLATSVGRIFCRADRHRPRSGGARISSTREIAILEKLAVKQPDNRSWQYDLSRAYNRHGLLLSKLGRSTGALHGLSIRPRHPAKARGGGARQHRVPARPVRQLQPARRSVGQDRRATDALAAYRGALPDMQKLAASDPSNNQWQENLASGYDKIGDTLDFGRDRRGLGQFSQCPCHSRAPGCRRRHFARSGRRDRSQPQQDRRHSAAHRRARRRRRALSGRPWISPKNSWRKRPTTPICKATSPIATSRWATSARRTTAPRRAIFIAKASPFAPNSSRRTAPTCSTGAIWR